MGDDGTVTHDSLPLKACAIGSQAVGKTTFFIRFIQGSFPGDYTRAVYEPTRYETSSDEHEVSIELNDVRSRLLNPQLKPLIYQNTDVVMMFYSVSDRESYLDVERVWLVDAQTHCPGVPIVLVGTKTDLREVGGDTVTTGEGKELARRVRATKFMEISSLLGEGLDDMMDEVVKCAVDHKLRKSSDSVIGKQRRPCRIL